jgi:leucyl-tRNA synthetase
MVSYNPQKIEKKWQKKWGKEGIYKTRGNRKKFYVLDMFPYPSGEGLHVGHPRGYIATDVFTRYKMMQGRNVLHPMGWDAFGLPAENYALKHKIHPKIAVPKNIKRFKQQLEKFGFTYDWSKEINTTDPEYYKWTQWIFLKLFENGLVYESHEPIIWCPSCKTGLALEDLEDGKCERCGSEVEKKPLRQWVLKMTAYAEKLLKDLNLLDWPESIKEQQRNWIGKSEGAVVKFQITNSKSQIEVFTTRLDTIFGCTYLVAAPEHLLIQNSKFVIQNYDEVAKYIKEAKKKPDLQRTDLAKEKTGVELKGVKAKNPFNNEEVSIFVADYVLGHYGTGAVMAVPAHDERDWEFAKKYGLPIKEVVLPNRIDKKNPPVPGKKTEERKNVHAIVRNPQNNKFLCLKSKKFGWTTFPMGGIEEGEDVVAAAQREVEEETGYKNLKLVRVLGGEVRAEYFAKHKDENRVAYTTGVLFNLINEEKSPVDKEWEDSHELMWIDEKDVNYDVMCHAEMNDWIMRLNGKEAYTEDGILVNSGRFSGLSSAEARKKMAKWLEENNLGEKKINYKMRDWVFARQRYWGEPFPLVFCGDCSEKIRNKKFKKGEFTKGELTNPGWIQVQEKNLPVELPDVKSYEPSGTGESPLVSMVKWVSTKCPKCRGSAKRETNTMPQWAGSCWYYIGYLIKKGNKYNWDKKEIKKWLPVDLYVGGVEHATRHLLYARFWHKFLYDIKQISSKEPFNKLMNQGLILAEDGRKMSKRWGNVVNPDEMIKQFGADSLRLYEMFIGPFAQSVVWNMDGIKGIKRFLDRVWKLYVKNSDRFVDSNASADLDRLLHQTIKKVTDDIENFHFNTAVSALMILINEIEKQPLLKIKNWKLIIKLLAPFAPHLAEEIWRNGLKSKKSVHLEQWPQYDPKLIKEEKFELVMQVNGKVKDRLRVKTGISQKEAENLVFMSDKIKNALAGRKIRKIIFVPNRLINMVV